MSCSLGGSCWCEYLTAQQVTPAAGPCTTSDCTFHLRRGSKKKPNKQVDKGGKEESAPTGTAAEHVDTTIAPKVIEWFDSKYKWEDISAKEKPKVSVIQKPNSSCRIVVAAGGTSTEMHDPS